MAKDLTIDFGPGTTGDKWFRTSRVAVREFGETVIFFRPCGTWTCEGPTPFWAPNIPTTTAAIDAAYQTYLQELQTPRLQWDDSLACIKRAKHRLGEYHVREVSSIEWRAEFHTATGRLLLGSHESEEKAKAACERHGR